MYRVALGWRQADLALAAGVARETVRRIERGESMPRRTTAQALADALGAPVDEVFRGVSGGAGGRA